MFSPEELITDLHQFAYGETLPLEIVEFGYMDFDTPSMEQGIWAFRGLKQDFDSGPRFWIATLRAQGWEDRETCFIPYAESGLCRLIGAFSFRQLVAEYSGSLRNPLPPFVGASATFIDAQLMYDDWNDVAALAETEDSFVAFYWSTTT